MSKLMSQRPFPDYVTCPHCDEPEVEVWCYALTARCHACQQIFPHARPGPCLDKCDPAQCEQAQPPATQFH